ncbi:MAG: DUF4125 family protein [Lachnospiraceae bacterium]
MKILVIGGTYFLGKCFVNMAKKTHRLTLLNRGTRILEDIKDEVNWIFLDRHALGMPGTSALQGNAANGMQAEEDTTASARALLGELEPDIVVDFCAYEKGDIRTMVSALWKGLKKYIFISTCDVYQRGTGKQMTEDSPFEERHFPGEVGTYISGKVALEKELEEVCRERGIQAVSIRPAFIYGPDNYAPREFIYFRWMQAAGQIIEPVGEDNSPATGFFQMTHVEDVAKAILFACENEIGRALNVCGEKMDYAQFSRCLKGILPSLTVLPVPIPQLLEKQVPLPFPFYQEESEWYSNAAMKRIGLGEIDLQEGMAATYRWYLESQNRMEVSAAESEANPSVEEILQHIDALFEANQAKEAEHYMLSCLEQARVHRDCPLQMTILNELIGYYRVTSQAEHLRSIMEQAMKLGQEMGLENSVPFATTLLNVANGYRSIGELELSLQYYGMVEQIYREQLSPEDLNVAGLYNNKSLLLEEMQRYQQAKECLDKALAIVTKQNADFEIAVTHANLANTLVAMKDFEEATIHAKESISRFRDMNCLDSHYAAALSALAMCRFENKEYREALSLFREGMYIIENSFGQNSQYKRMLDNYNKCLEMSGAEAQDHLTKPQLQEQQPQEQQPEHQPQEQQPELQPQTKEQPQTGLEICRLYYEKFGKPMIAEKFPDYQSKIAVGLVGEGSDCYGFDDAFSRDHDWGPGFCMWVTRETYDVIGTELQACYDQLPDELMGFRRAREVSGAGRRGVFVIEEFYNNLLGYPFEEPYFSRINEYGLAAAVNGEVFYDEEGIFTRIREQLKCGYPRYFLLLQMAEDMAIFSQNLQYNYFRMRKRNDILTADLMLANGIQAALKLQLHMAGRYVPHDKWLRKSVAGTDGGEELLRLLEEMHRCMAQQAKMQTKGAFENEGQQATCPEDVFSRMEELSAKLGEFFAKRLYAMDIISDIDYYLDHHVEEILLKSNLAKLPGEEVIGKIISLETEAYVSAISLMPGQEYSAIKELQSHEKHRQDNVAQNDLQDHEKHRQDNMAQNEPAGSISKTDEMSALAYAKKRKKKYETWSEVMLWQYYYDFSREYKLGHNLLLEKWQRMLEWTDAKAYAKVKDTLPYVDGQKKQIAEALVSFCTKDREQANELRSELQTYSDKMLQLFGGFVIQSQNN